MVADNGGATAQPTATEPRRKHRRRVFSPFAPVLATLKRSGSGAGFREARNLLLEQYEVFKREIGAANVLKLAIECDRHALFSDVAKTKVKTKEYFVLWSLYQRYLSGGISLEEYVRLSEDRAAWGIEEEDAPEGGEAAVPDSAKEEHDGEGQ